MTLIALQQKNSGYRYKKLSRLASLVLLTAFMSGCSDPATRNELDHTAETARQGLIDGAHPAPIKHYNPLVVTDKVWGGDTAIRMHRGTPLPAKYETAHGVTVVSSAPMALTEIASVISQQTGIAVHFNPAEGNSSSASPVVSAPSAPSGIPSGMAGFSGLPAGFGGGAMSGGIPGSSLSMGAGGALASNASSRNGPEMEIAYEGPLSGLLDHVAAYFGMNWRYDGTSISINRFETRVFAIEALPGTQSVADGIDNSGGGSSSGGSGSSSGGSSGSSSGSSSSSSSGATTGTITQTTKFSIDLKYWDELGQILNAMLGGVGSVTVSPSIGTVTVSTTSDNMRQIADYLTKENQRLSRQIAINVEIYTVNLTQGFDFDVAFNTVLKKLTDNLLVNVTNGVTAPAAANAFSGGGSLSVAVLGNSTNKVSDVFTALSAVGDTTSVAKFPLITINNRPSSRFVGQDVNYVSNTTTTAATGTTTTATTTSAGLSTSITTSTVKPGFSVQATPRLLDDGRILLQYSLSIVSLISIDSFNSVCGSSSSTAGAGSSACTASAAANGSQTVQLPKTSTREFVQQAVLKSGNTLVLGGAEQEDLTHNSQGVGDPYNYALGGGASSNKAHLMIFYAITPQVLDTPHSEQD